MARTNDKVTVHEVLAGAYRGKDIGTRTLLTHASLDGGDTALCGRVKPGSFCDLRLTTAPTCQRCLAVWNARLGVES
jgi:hypothetical protein